MFVMPGWLIGWTPGARRIGVEDRAAPCRGYRRRTRTPPTSRVYSRPSKCADRRRAPRSRLIRLPFAGVVDRVGLEAERRRRRCWPLVVLVAPNPGSLEQRADRRAQIGTCQNSSNHGSAAPNRAIEAGPQPQLVDARRDAGVRPRVRRGRTSSPCRPRAGPRRRASTSASCRRAPGSSARRRARGGPGRGRCG